MTKPLTATENMKIRGYLIDLRDHTRNYEEWHEINDLINKLASLEAENKGKRTSVAEMKEHHIMRQLVERGTSEKA